MRSSRFTASALDGWLASYRHTSHKVLDDPEFAAWLQIDYIPIAGGWQY